MPECNFVSLGDVAFESVERFGSAESDRPVYGVDKAIGLTSEPRYQSANLTRYKKIKAGMFAYNPMRLNIGSIGFCSSHHEEGIVSPDYIVFSCRPDRLIPEFLDYHTGTKAWSEWLGLAGEGSVRERIYFKKLAQYRFPLPDTVYQNAAVKVLSSLDDKIDLNRRLSATLEGVAHTIFRDWFVDFGPVRRKIAGASDPIAIVGGMISDSGKAASLAALFPDELSDNGLPVGWSDAPIYDFASVIYGAPFSSKRFNTDRIGRPLVRIRDLSKHESDLFTEEVHSREYAIQPGDIVVGMDGEFRARIWQGIPSLMNQRVCCFKPKSSDRRAFVYFSIKPSLDRLEKSAVGTTVIHLGKGDIDRFRGVDPGDTLIATFGSIVETMFDRLTANGFESRTLAETRDYLLPRLMSGKLRITDAESLVA